MICRVCKKEVSIQIMTPNHGILCENCNMHKFPYIINLVRKSNGNTIYNTTHNVTEKRITIKQFQDCGWFIRQRKERGSFVYFRLEYHGKTKCSKCGNYKFPPTMNFCDQYKTCA